jgi:hypothetical protein
MPNNHYRQDAEKLHEAFVLLQRHPCLIGYDTTDYYPKDLNYLYLTEPCWMDLDLQDALGLYGGNARLLRTLPFHLIRSIKGALTPTTLGEVISFLLEEDRYNYRRKPAVRGYRYLSGFRNIGRRTIQEFDRFLLRSGAPRELLRRLRNIGGGW